jgi:glycosyltransferase involved in cell wall biosynthesis
LEYDSALLKSAYSNCKLLVLPSYNETFGLAILEAVSAGANVAVSSTLPILDYGVFGKDNIFSPNDADDIRKVVTNIYNQPKPTDLYEKMKMAFSWESIVTQHIDCYSGH